LPSTLFVPSCNGVGDSLSSERRTCSFSLYIAAWCRGVLPWESWQLGSQRCLSEVTSSSRSPRLTAANSGDAKLPWSASGAVRT